MNQLSGGKFPNVAHFDSKATVERYIRDLGIPATFFLPGFYMPNIPGGFLRQFPPNNDWTMALPIPDGTPIPLFDPAEDTGTFVKAILTHRDTVLGKQILAATDYYTPTQIVDTFKEVYPQAGQETTFLQLEKEQFKGALAQAGMPEKGREELYENMAFMPEYGYYGKASLNESLSVSSFQ